MVYPAGTQQSKPGRTRAVGSPGVPRLKFSFAKPIMWIPRTAIAVWPSPAAPSGWAGYAVRFPGRYWDAYLLIIGVLNNGLFLLNVSPFWQQVVKGV
jgi:hypothetical protein